ncbi:MAG: hypothetical protein WAM72_23560, partial [Xanthobacteraceae bacterium]
MVVDALKAMQSGRDPSRYVTFGDPGCEHLVKAIFASPVPFRTTLPNTALKCRLGHKKLPLTGGSVGQLPHLKGY